MIVAVTGSVAALKLPELLRLLLPKFNIKLVTSESVLNY
jgi:phosphopantothenoylcysteine synthetase/decarboxylase